MITTNIPPIDLKGLEKQMITDCLTDLIDMTENDEGFTNENIDKMTKRNQDRSTYLRSLK